MTPTNRCSQRCAAARRSGASRMFSCTNSRMAPASPAAASGVSIQAEAMMPILTQFTAAAPSIAIPAPARDPTIEWVVLTGRPAPVAMVIQAAAAISADRTVSCAGRPVPSCALSNIPSASRVVTGPPAIAAPATSAMATRISPGTSRTAPAPKAGPRELAMSFAPIATPSQPATISAEPTAIRPGSCPVTPSTSSHSAISIRIAPPSRRTGRMACIWAFSTWVMLPRSLSRTRKSRPAIFIGAQPSLSSSCFLRTC